MDAELKWIDGFLFWDLVIVTILVLADWLLGEEKRKAIREKLGDWWLHVEGISFVGLVAEDAQKVRKGLQRVFGEKWTGFRCIFLSIVISLVLTLAVVTASLSILILPGLGEFDELVEGIWNLYYLFAVQNAVLDWLSVAFTIFLLKLMERQVTTLRLAGLVLVDSLAALLLAGIALSVGMGILDWWKSGFAAAVVVAFALIPIIAIAFTSALPTLVHLTLAIIFMASKLYPGNDALV